MAHVFPEAENPLNDDNQRLHRLILAADPKYDGRCAAWWKPGDRMLYLSAGVRRTPDGVARLRIRTVTPTVWAALVEDHLMQGDYGKFTAAPATERGKALGFSLVDGLRLSGCDGNPFAPPTRWNTMSMNVADCRAYAWRRDTDGMLMCSLAAHWQLFDGTKLQAHGILNGLSPQRYGGASDGMSVWEPKKEDTDDEA